MCECEEKALFGLVTLGCQGLVSFPPCLWKTHQKLHYQVWEICEHVEAGTVTGKGPLSIIIAHSCGSR